MARWREDGALKAGRVERLVLAFKIFRAILADETVIANAIMDSKGNIKFVRKAHVYGNNFTADMKINGIPVDEFDGFKRERAAHPETREERP